MASPPKLVNWGGKIGGGIRGMGHFRPGDGDEAQETFVLEEELYQISRVELYGGSEDLQWRIAGQVEGFQAVGMELISSPLSQLQK